MNVKMKKSLIEQYKQLDSCTLSDAFDKLNIGQGGYIYPKQMVSHTTICGPAYTVRYLPKVEHKIAFGNFLDDIPQGSVVVIDNQGRTDGSVWGDTMAFYAQKKGVEGTVINGVYRDVGAIEALKYPVYAKGYSIKSGKDLVGVDATNVSIQMDDVLIRPNDLIFGDESGVIVIPFEYAEEILEKAHQLKAQDDQLVENIMAGLSYEEAKSKKIE